MKLLKKKIAVAVAAAIFMMTSVPCFAADNALKEIFEDGLYGGLTGTLVGAAILAFTHKPGNHLDYMGYGAAVGVLGGVSYGIVKSTKALAEVDHGKVKFAFPTITPDFPDSSVRGKNPVVITTELLRGKF